jgi:hypothetical protein
MLTGSRGTSSNMIQVIKGIHPVIVILCMSVGHGELPPSSESRPGFRQLECNLINFDGWSVGIHYRFSSLSSPSHCLS